MSTDKLIKELEEQEYILPKDVLQGTSEDELVKQLEDIFNSHKDLLEANPEFRTKYIELVNYLFVLNLQKDKSDQKGTLFNEALIEYLLSSPRGV